ncbi:hypothetical protein VTN02DRAFT_1038 [Thermoascus thermophilus]
MRGKLLQPMAATFQHDGLRERERERERESPKRSLFSFYYHSYILESVPSEQQRCISSPRSHLWTSPKQASSTSVSRRIRPRPMMSPCGSMPRIRRSSSPTGRRASGYVASGRVSRGTGSGREMSLRSLRRITSLSRLRIWAWWEWERCSRA